MYSLPYLEEQIHLLIYNKEYWRKKYDFSHFQDFLRNVIIDKAIEEQYNFIMLALPHPHNGRWDAPFTMVTFYNHSDLSSLKRFV